MSSKTREHQDDSALLAERMRLIERMQRRIAHDLRGPLNVLSLNVDLIGASVESAGDERLLKYLGALRRELAGLQAAFAGWLSLMEPWEAASARVDVGTAISEANSLLAGEARARGAQLDVSSGDAPLAVEGSPAGLQFVILSIGWSVLVRLGRGDGLEIAASRDGSETCVEWRARTEGAAPLDVFEPGLLDAARSIVESHGGRFETPGTGAVARVRLPIVPASRT